MGNKNSIVQSVMVFSAITLIGGTIVYDLFRDKTSNPRREYHYDGFIEKEKVSFTEKYSTGTLQIKRPNGERIIFHDKKEVSSYNLTSVIYESIGRTNIHTPDSLYGKEIMESAKFVYEDYMSAILSSNKSKAKSIEKSVREQMLNHR